MAAHKPARGLAHRPFKSSQFSATTQLIDPSTRERLFDCVLRRQQVAHARRQRVRDEQVEKTIYTHTGWIERMSAVPGVHVVVDDYKPSTLGVK